MANRLSWLCLAISFSIAPEESLSPGRGLTVIRARLEVSLTDKNAGKEARPGSWIILEKSSSNQPRTLDEPDFDRIYVVGYDKRNQEHYTAYRSPDLKGILPLRVEGRGENKTFTVRAQDRAGRSRTRNIVFTKTAGEY